MSVNPWTWDAAPFWCLFFPVWCMSWVLIYAVADDLRTGRLTSHTHAIVLGVWDGMKLGLRRIVGLATRRIRH